MNQKSLCKKSVRFLIWLAGICFLTSVAGWATTWSNTIQVSGVGWEGQGAGVAFTNFDSNSRPEMVLLAYDNPSKDNSFRYKIGWNVKTNGIASSWSSPIQVSGVGWEGQGAGVAFTNLDGNSRPEMVLMAYDNPSKDNSFRYRIGWNVNTSGKAVSWDSFEQVGGVGWEGQGAGLTFANLDGDSKEEMILMAYDNPSKGNSFRYKIGWDFSPPPPSNEDSDNQFAGYVSDEEDRFVGYVWGFVDEFQNTWQKAQYYWGACRMLGSQHLSYADSVDLVYTAGHGNASLIVLKGSEGGCDLSRMAWGSYSSPDRRGDLEYIVFHSCSVLKMDSNWRGRWRHYSSTKNEKRPFSGLHIAMGFRTTHYNGLGAGRKAADLFAENLEDGLSVRKAWYNAARDARWLAGWKDNKPAIFYIRPHKDEKISQHNSKDYHYGDPEYLLDAYYMN